MKLYNLLQIRTIINEHIKDTDLMPAQLAYKIMKIMKNTQNDIIFYQEQINKIINTYGEKDENGNLIQQEQGVKIIENKLPECNQKMAELNNTEVEFPNIKFSLKELEPFKFSVVDMYQLDEIIKED